MKKILCTLPAPEECAAPFRNEFDITIPERDLTREELLERIGNYDALYQVHVQVDKEMLDAAAAGKCRAIANFGVGYDNMDVAYATKKGIAVINTPTAVTEATAEHTAALIFTVMRDITAFDRDLRNHIWDSPFFPTRATQIDGSTLGILGFGRIGRRVAARAQVMGMNVIYYDVHRLPEDTEKALKVTYRSFGEVVAEADCITLHMPYTSENHHLINADVFGKMKKDACFINVARGRIVDERALYEALRDGKIKSAGIDVFENEPHPLEELLALPNITLTPHCASGTWKTRCSMAREGFEGLAEVLRGRVPYNVVNPEAFG